MTAATTTPVDIALLLEGTFPYVSGGVSSWVNQMIRAFPERRFGIVFIGSRRQDYGEMKYALPDNVVHLESHYLHDMGRLGESVRPRRGDGRTFTHVDAFHDGLLSVEAIPETLARFRDLMPALLPGGTLPIDDLLYSERAWEMLRTRYRKHCTDPSFVDYFWTVRIMHAPLWRLAAIARAAPPASVFHSVSTGYAGFLGALLAHLRGRPLILSEHGIYTKERKIDLFQSAWIRDNRNVFQRDPTELSYFRQMWIRFFEWLGRFCYDAADPIVALFEANRQRQIVDGADSARTRTIPNGVRVERFLPARAARPTSTPSVLCLIGRVVPIKDVKNFVRAMRIVINQMPQAEGWIAGPEDEDPDYARECRELAESLGIGEHVRFLGFRRVEELMPQIGLTVLTSISEGLPLSILEGYAAGVPTVCTDVGACRELVCGAAEDDRALGMAGEVVGIADPQAVARAALRLLGDASAWSAASDAAIARVERYYTDTQMIARYRDIYDRALAQDGA